jgi:hypothetical protein
LICEQLTAAFSQVVDFGLCGESVLADGRTDERTDGGARAGSVAAKQAAEAATDGSADRCVPCATENEFDLSSYHSRYFISEMNKRVPDVSPHRKRALDWRRATVGRKRQ